MRTLLSPSPSGRFCLAKIMYVYFFRFVTDVYREGV